MRATMASAVASSGVVSVLVRSRTRAVRKLPSYSASHPAASLESPSVPALASDARARAMSPLRTQPSATARVRTVRVPGVNHLSKRATNLSAAAGRPTIASARACRGTVVRAARAESPIGPSTGSSKSAVPGSPARTAALAARNVASGVRRQRSAATRASRANGQRSSASARVAKSLHAAALMLSAGRSLSALHPSMAEPQLISRPARARRAGTSIGVPSSTCLTAVLVPTGVGVSA